MRRVRVRVRFRWYDLWVGVYIDVKHRRLFICPLPCLVIEISRRRFLITGVGRRSYMLRQLNDLAEAMVITQEDIAARMVGLEESDDEDSDSATS